MCAQVRFLGIFTGLMSCTPLSGNRPSSRAVLRSQGDWSSRVNPGAAGSLGAAVKRYHVTTFGCQMNEHDSERMKGMLEALGYEEAPERAGADLILFNTCSIRERADERFVAHLHE